MGDTRVIVNHRLNILTVNLPIDKNSEKFHAKGE